MNCSNLGEINLRESIKTESGLWSNLTSVTVAIYIDHVVIIYLVLLKNYDYTTVVP